MRIASSQVVDRALRPSTLRALVVQDLNSPAVRLGTKDVAGEVQWTAHLRDLPLSGRAEALRALEPLIANQHSAERRNTWCEMGQPQADEAWTEEHLVLIGDRSALPHILAALMAA